MFKLLLLLWSMTFSTAVFAVGGTGVVDGGHGIVCIHGAEMTVQSLDAAEARATGALYGSELEASLGSATDWVGYEAAAHVIVERARLSLGRRNSFVQLLESELQRVQLQMRATVFRIAEVPSAFTESEDFGSVDVTVPVNCSLAQLAISKSQGASAKVIFNPRYIERLTKVDRLALIVHESLHAWFFPERSTRLVRLATRYLISDGAYRARNAVAFQHLIDERVEQDFQRP